MVVQPAAIPHLSMSVDYYNIKVTDVIGSATPGDLMAACFSNLSATNPDCLVIRRNPVTGGLDGDPATTLGLFAPLTNLGKLYTNGIDVAINYNHEFGKIKWAASIVGNYTMHQKFKANAASATSLDRDCVGYFSPNCGSIAPKFQWSWRNTFTYGKMDLSVLWRHIDKMVQEPDDIANGRGPGFVGTVPAGAESVSGTQVDFGKIPSYDYFDLSLRFNVNDNFTLTGTVQNLFNKQPPLVGTNIGSTSYNSGNTFPSTYDALGRRFAVSGKVKF
jgi:iron complex outermembrane recepter protein